MDSSPLRRLVPHKVLLAAVATLMLIAAADIVVAQGPPSGPPPGVRGGPPPGVGLGPPGGAPSAAAGLYLSPFWLGALMVATALWLYLTSWVSDDAKGNGMDYMKHSAYMLGTGGLGLLLALLVHAAFVFLMFALYLGMFAVYVVERNKVVPEMLRIFGPHHRNRILAAIPVLNKVGALRSKSRAGKPAVDLTSEKGESLTDLLQSEPSLSPGGVALAELVLHAGATKTRRVRLHPAGDQYVAQYVLDGVLHNVQSLDSETGRQVLACASRLAGLSKDGRLRAGNGEISTELPGMGEMKIEVQTAVADGKPALTLAFPDWTHDLYLGGLAGLGMHETMVKRVKAALDQKRGALLVCSPSGGGRTTTLYAVAGMVDVFTNDMAVVEDRSEHELDHVRRWEFGADKSFTDVYADIMREGPNVILLGELNKSDQAEKVLDFASEGGLVLTTVRAPDSPECLLMLAKLTGAADLVPRAVTCVVSQRLVRKLCPSCRELIEPAPELLKRLNVDPADPGVWYKPAGCSACLNSGYQGRTGIFGMLILTDPVKKILQTPGATAQAVRQAAGQAAFRTMYQDGVSKVVAGITTLDEVRRVLKGQ